MIYEFWSYPEQKLTKNISTNRFSNHSPCSNIYREDGEKNNVYLETKKTMVDWLVSQKKGNGVYLLFRPQIFRDPLPFKILNANILLLFKICIMFGVHFLKVKGLLNISDLIYMYVYMVEFE